MTDFLNDARKLAIQKTSREAPEPDAPFPNSLKILYRKIDSIRPSPQNARVHSRAQLNKLKRCIETFGFIVPVLIQHDGTIIAGAGRVEAARNAGLKEIPTINLDHLSPEQIRAFRIADNRLNELSSWSPEILAHELKFLSEVNLEVETAFEVPEIDLRIASLNLDPDEDAPEASLDAPPGPPITKLGTTWILGEHRLHCGNALDPAVFNVLMDGKKAAAVISDPPYNVPVEGHVSGRGSVHHREFAMASGEMTSDKFQAFLTSALGSAAAHTKSGGLFYVFMDWRHAGEILAAARVLGFELLNICVWAKSNAGLGSYYRSQHEFCFVFKHGRVRHRNNILLGKYGRNRSNVWEYPGINQLGSTGEEGKLLALHPTVKPVRLIADIILDCTANGDVVLDPFIGSGSSIVAAERVRRRCFGLEIDPAYVDTAVRRWEAFSGASAVDAATGKPFSVEGQRA